MKSFITLLFLASVILPGGYAWADGAAQAAAKRNKTLKCRKIVPLKKQRSVLYKDNNIHGGRGRTFIDQDRQLGGPSRLYVAGLNKRIFSCFGLWSCAGGWGCRYYQATCGDRLSNKDFIRKAKRNSNGRPKALVGAGKGKCFLMTATASREGNVH